MKINSVKRSLVRCSIILFILLLADPLSLQGQISQSERVGASMPSIIPLSPEVAGIAKFSGYPVNYYTGLPEISIPLFEVKTKDMNLPVILRYHASGIKVADVASWVGLGWSLEAGGMINRKILGKPDESGTLDVREANNINLQITDPNIYDLYLPYILNGNIDAEPDYYYYSYPGASGSFQFLNGTTFLMPRSPIKVQMSPAKITESDGRTFYFNHPVNNSVTYPSKPTSNNGPSTWFLTKMVNANKTDSITLTYQSSGSGTLSETIRDYIIVEDDASPNNSDFTPAIMYYDGELVSVSGNEYVNSEIAFSGGKMQFILSSLPRLDRIQSFKSLDTIKIFSATDYTRPFKYIVFHKSYFINSDETRLKLDSLQFADKDKKVILCYKFDYYTDNKLPGYLSRSKDWWGYYNGRTNTCLIPRHLVPYNVGLDGPGQEYIGNDPNARTPDTSKIKAYSLKSIIYPTGGKTTFKYEANMYSEGGLNRIASGLRIRKMITEDGNGNSQLRTFEYNQNRNNGFQYTILEDSFPSSIFRTSSTKIYLYTGDDPTSIRSTIYSSDPVVDLDPYDGSSVVYPMVTEYFGSENNNTGKIVYQYNDQADEPIHLSGNFNSAFAPLIFTDRSPSQRVKLLNHSFERGQLIRKSIYKNEGNEYRLVSRVENQYGVFPPQTIYNTGLIVWTEDIFYGSSTINYYSKYNYHNYPAYTADNLLKYTAEYSYDQNDEAKFIKAETYYSYNNSQYLQVNRIKSIGSDGDTLIRKVQYPTDIASGIYAGMISSNLIGIPVEENEFLEGTHLTSTRSNYTKKYFNKFYSPSSVEQRNGTDPWKTRIRYMSYDTKGNIITLNKEEDLHVSYAYDINNQPIAEVLNADSLSFYFNSFENADGNSVTNDCRTGQKSRTGGFSRIIPLSEGPYILSYWQKSGSDWVYVKNTITASSGNYYISITGQLDDLRIYPSVAQMTTYTYDPSTGMTSKTDPNEVTTYYEYDSFGRLKYIKDDKKNILKFYEYHYKE